VKELLFLGKIVKIIDLDDRISLKNLMRNFIEILMMMVNIENDAFKYFKNFIKYP